jgi:hypothetical protein
VVASRFLESLWTIGLLNCLEVFWYRMESLWTIGLLNCLEVAWKFSGIEES